MSPTTCTDGNRTAWYRHCRASAPGSATPAFGTPASTPAFGSFGAASTPAFSTPGSSNAFNSTFGAASTPSFSFAAASTPAFGQASPLPVRMPVQSGIHAAAASRPPSLSEGSFGTPEAASLLRQAMPRENPSCTVMWRAMLFASQPFKLACTQATAASAPAFGGAPAAGTSSFGFGGAAGPLGFGAGSSQQTGAFSFASQAAPAFGQAQSSPSLFGSAQQVRQEATVRARFQQQIFTFMLLLKCYTVGLTAFSISDRLPHNLD